MMLRSKGILTSHRTGGSHMHGGKYENYHENKSHTSAGFPYNTYLCTIPQDFESVALHWHDDAEIIYIKKGRGIVSVDLEDIRVEAGDIVFILPGRLHSIRSYPNVRMEYENIIFDMEFLSSKLPERMYSEYFTPMLDGELEFPVLISPETCRKYADAAHFIDMADDCCRDRAQAYEIAVKGYLFCFFSALFSDCKPVSAYKTNDNVEKLKSVLRHIEKNYSDIITIDEMASLCCFSSSHFMRFFKQTMGMPFTTYLNDYRLTLAAKSLLETHKAVLEIASECGFENLSYFNRIFKKKYGITPREYRQRQP